MNFIFARTTEYAVEAGARCFVAKPQRSWVCAGTESSTRSSWYRCDTRAGMSSRSRQVLLGRWRRDCHYSPRLSGSFATTNYQLVYSRQDDEIFACVLMAAQSLVECLCPGLPPLYDVLRRGGAGVRGAERGVLDPSPDPSTQRWYQ